MANSSTTNIANIRSALEDGFQPFRFMDLPPEIRALIFKEGLIMPGPINFKNAVYHPSNSYWRCLRLNPPFAVSGQLQMYTVTDYRGCRREFIDSSKTMTITQSTLLDLFLVSETFKFEATPIYFGHNTFAFDDLSRCQHFLDIISPEARWQISRLIMTWSAWSGATAGRVARLLCRCPSLRGLVLRLSHDATSWAPKDSLHKLQLHGMGTLLKARGLTDLEVEVPSILYCYENQCTHDAAHRPLGKNKDIEDLVERLQVLKQPREAKDLDKLAKKDFPE